MNRENVLPLLHEINTIIKGTGGVIDALEKNPDDVNVKKALLSIFKSVKKMAVIQKSALCSMVDTPDRPYDPSDSFIDGFMDSLFKNKNK